MKQKKLIIFMPSIESGGVEKNLFIISKYLAKKIKHVAIITSDKKKINEINNNIKILTHHKYFSSTNKRFLKYISCLMLLFKEIINNKDILVFSLQANLYAILLCKIFGIKIIARANSSSSIWASNFFKITIFKFILKLADKIVVNSSDLKKEFSKKFKVATTLIFNPLNYNEIKKLSKKKLQSNFFKYKKNEIKIINIGRLTYQKDQITLLKALKVLNKKINFKALIIGNGQDKLILKKYIKKNELSKKIKIINYMKNPFPLLKSADVFVLTSIYEGLPNVILEALVLKKVIFSTDCPTGPREILQNGKVGNLYKIKDYKSLSYKLLDYKKNKKKYQKKLIFSKASLKRFDYNNNLKKYFILIKELI